MALETLNSKTIRHCYVYQAPRMKCRDINHLPCYLSSSQRLDGRGLATD